MNENLQRIQDELRRLAEETYHELRADWQQQGTTKTWELRGVSGEECQRLELLLSQIGYTVSDWLAWLQKRCPKSFKPGPTLWGDDGVASQTGTVYDVAGVSAVAVPMVPQQAAETDTPEITNDTNRPDDEKVELTIPAAARFVGCHPSSIRRWMNGIGGNLWCEPTESNRFNWRKTELDIKKKTHKKPS